MRLKYGDGVRALYIGAVMLGGILLAAALLGDDTVFHNPWYITGEAVLTVSYAVEVCVHMWLSGPMQYVKHSYSNVAELGLCAGCCLMFGMSLWQKYARLEIEAALVSLRYSAQLARLYFFIRQHNTVGRGNAKVSIHDNDNPTVSLQHQETPAQARPLWCQEDGGDDDIV